MLWSARQRREGRRDYSDFPYNTHEENSRIPLNHLELEDHKHVHQTEDVDGVSVSGVQQVEDGGVEQGGRDQDHQFLLEGLRLQCEEVGRQEPQVLQDGGEEEELPAQYGHLAPISKEQWFASTEKYSEMRKNDPRFWVLLTED